MKAGVGCDLIAACKGWISETSTHQNLSKNLERGDAPDLEQSFISHSRMAYSIEFTWKRSCDECLYLLQFYWVIQGRQFI